MMNKSKHLYRIRLTRFVQEHIIEIRLKLLKLKSRERGYHKGNQGSVNNKAESHRKRERSIR